MLEAIIAGINAVNSILRQAYINHLKELIDLTPIINRLALM